MRLQLASTATRSRSTGPTGYSLVEMAVVLAIIGTITGGALVLGTAQEEQNQARTTKGRLDRIEAAIQRHAYMSGSLPCPALPTATETTPEYGISEDCSQASPSDASVAEVNDGTPEEIWIGTVPTRSLNLPDSDMYDGWGNRFSYAVVRGQAVADGLDDYSTTATNGVIEITDAAGNQIPDASALNIVSYALISHGKDGKGAYSRTGAQVTACDAAAKDGENCNEDATFIDSRFADSEIAANYYDDLLRWRLISFARPVNLPAQEEEEECEAPTSGLVGHWKFDEASGSATAADSSGGNNTGTLTNMDPATDWVAGKVDGALDFDGTNDYVNVGSSVTSNLSVFSVSAWFKTSIAAVVEDDYFIIGKADGGNYFWGLTLQHSGGSNKIMPITWQCAGGTHSSFTSSAAFDPMDEMWHHVVMVFNNNVKSELFVDGQSAASTTTFTGSLCTGSSADVNIGRRTDNQMYFDGIIDDVRIYNRVLDADAIGLLYNDGEGCEN